MLKNLSSIFENDYNEISGNSIKEIKSNHKKAQRKSNLFHSNYYIRIFFQYVFAKRIFSIFTVFPLILSVVLYLAASHSISSLFDINTEMNVGDLLNRLTYEIINIFSPINGLLNNSDKITTLNEIDYFTGKSIMISNLSSLKSIFQFTFIIGSYSFFAYFYNKFVFDRVSHSFQNVYYQDVLDQIYPYNFMGKELIIGKVFDEETTDITLKPKYVVIPDKGQRQNIIILGSISTGKTIAALANIVLQLLYSFYNDVQKKAAGLILDVKGNFGMFPKRFLAECGRAADLIEISLNGNIKINFLHKPHLSPMEIASRMRYVLEIFSKSGNEDYFIDKAEVTLAELIKLQRVYADYVTFQDIHDLIIYEEKRKKVFKELEKLRLQGQLNDIQEYDYLSCKSYFENEFGKLDDKLREIIVSEVTRMTNPFISKKEVKDIFCPTVNEINFIGFDKVIEEGKIVLWSINGNKEKKLSKLVAAYLKIDFQEEVMNTLEYDHDSVSYKRQKILVCDEYQHYCTKNDADYVSQSREANGVSVVASQSYASLLSSLKNDEQVFNMLIQSFVNKIIFRIDDTSFTVKKIKEQFGKKDSEKITENINEAARDSKADHVLGQSFGDKKNLTQGQTITQDKIEMFDESFMNRALTEGKAICLLTDGLKLYDPVVVHLPRQHKEGRIKLIDPVTSTFKWIDFRPMAVGDTPLNLDDVPISNLMERDQIDREIRVSIPDDSKQEQAPVKAAPSIEFNLPPVKAKPIKPTPDQIKIDFDTGEYVAGLDQSVEKFSMQGICDIEPAAHEQEIEELVMSENGPAYADHNSLENDFNEISHDDAVEILSNPLSETELDKADDEMIKMELAKKHDFGNFF